MPKSGISLVGFLCAFKNDVPNGAKKQYFILTFITKNVKIQGRNKFNSPHNHNYVVFFQHRSKPSF